MLEILKAPIMLLDCPETTDAQSVCSLVLDSKVSSLQVSSLLLPANRALVVMLDGFLALYVKFDVDCMCCVDTKIRIARNSSELSWLIKYRSETCFFVGDMFESWILNCKKSILSRSRDPSIMEFDAVGHIRCRSCCFPVNP